MASSSRRKIVGLLTRDTLSNCERPVSSGGALAGRSPVSGTPAAPAMPVVLRDSSSVVGGGGAEDVQEVGLAGHGRDADAGVGGGTDGAEGARGGGDDVAGDVEHLEVE